MTRAARRVRISILISASAIAMLIGLAIFIRSDTALFGKHKKEKINIGIDSRRAVDEPDRQYETDELPLPLKGILKRPLYLGEKYKNPCWNPPGKKLACLPYFQVIGDNESGLADLCHRLKSHPEVVGNTSKETYWIPGGMFISKNGIPDLAPLTNYSTQFDMAVDEIQETTDGFGFHSKVIGACSPGTIWENIFWKLTRSDANKDGFEPVFTNADYLYFMNPNTKIIAIIRDPIERLYSDFMIYEEKPKTPQGFDAFVKENVVMFISCLEKNTLRGCVYSPTENAKSTIRLRLGIYHVYLADYLRIFPRDQVMVVKLEDYSRRTNFYLKQFFSFLELAPMVDKDLRAIVGIEDRNVGKNSRESKGGMLNRTRTILAEFYKSYNEELGKLLGEEYDYNIKS